jgi:hypothetical protein
MTEAEISTEAELTGVERLAGKNGSGYRGKQWRSNSGKKCIRWKTTVTHTHKYYPKAGLSRNYCRNPTPATADTIWCYIEGGKPSHMWEYCRPLNKDGS